MSRLLDKVARTLISHLYLSCIFPDQNSEASAKKNPVITLQRLILLKVMVIMIFGTKLDF